MDLLKDLLMNLGELLDKYYLPGKDSWHNFDIEGEAYREAQITAVLGRRPKLDEELEEVAEALLIPEPDNPYDSSAISVRVNGHVVGYLAREAAAIYRPIIHRITASGQVATTTVRIWAVVREAWEENGEPRFYSAIRIFLPEPHLILPLNNTPRSRVAVLPWGGALQVTGEDKHFDHLFNFLPAGGEGLLILTMHKLVHRMKNGTEKNLVEVRLDGQRVGQLTPATSAHFLPSIAHASDMDKELGVWAKIKGSGLAAELVIQGSRATELNDQWLSTMPTFHPLAPEAPSYHVPAAFTEINRDAGPRPQLTAGGQRPFAQRGPQGHGLPVPGTTTTPTQLPKKRDHGTLRLSEKDLQYSPGIHRMAGIAMIIIGVLVGALLGAIPAVGPVLFIACVALGVFGNVRSRKVARAVAAARSGSEAHG